MFGIDFCDVKKWNPGISSSFLKDTHITCSYRRVYRIQPEDNHETKLKRKSFKKLHSFKTLGKNGGVSSDTSTVQLQEKI